MSSIYELIKVTSDAINIGRKTIVLTLPAKKRTGKYCYPFGRGAPKAELLSTSNDKDVVSFDALDLLAFLVVANGNGIAEVKKCHT